MQIASLAAKERIIDIGPKLANAERKTQAEFERVRPVAEKRLAELTETAEGARQTLRQSDAYTLKPRFSHSQQKLTPR